MVRDQLLQAQKHLQPQQEPMITQIEKELLKLSQSIEQQVFNVRTAPESVRPLLLADIGQMQQKKEKLENQYKEQQQSTALVNQQKTDDLIRRKKELQSYLFHPQIFWQKVHSQHTLLLTLLPQRYIQHIIIDQNHKRISVFLQEKDTSYH